MEMSSSESFIEPPTSPSSHDEIDSLSSSATTSSADDDEYLSDADREWRESLQQLELLLTMVMVPYLGKYFGRKAAYWGTSCSRRGKIIKTRVLTVHRMGEVYGMAISRRNRVHEPENVQACRCYRGSSDTINSTK